MRYVLLALGFLFLSPAPDPEFDVHEWGVFNFYQGIGADILSGSEDLPDFVIRKDDLMPEECGSGCKCIGGNCPQDCTHEIWRKGGGKNRHCEDKCQGRQCTHQPMAMDKPVINIYSEKDIQLRISVDIHKGRVNRWYPTHTDASLKGMKVMWDNLIVTRSKKTLANAKDCTWWDLARDTDSSYLVTKKGDVEKFLFYEGESEELKPWISIKESKGKIALSVDTKHKFQGVFVIKDKKIKYLDEVSESVQIDLEKDLVEKPKAVQLIEALLKKDGLNEKEAKGVVKIWEKDFFEKEGLRVIYMMPRKEIDRILNVEITPKPKSFVRSMIACVNDTNFIVDGLIKKLGSDDPQIRDSATQTLIRIGKAIRSRLANALNVEKDPEVKSRLQKILDEIDGKKGSKLDEKDKYFVKDGECDGSCSRVHYAHPRDEKHTFGAKCTRCSKKMDLCYLLCDSCVKELNVCFGCNKALSVHYKDGKHCTCGKETLKADELKHQILLFKEGLSLNKKDGRYVIRSKDQWKNMLNELNLSLEIELDFSKEMAVGIDFGKCAKIDLRTIVEEEKRVRVVYTRSYPNPNKNEHTVVIVKFAKSDKPVEFCMSGD